MDYKDTAEYQNIQLRAAQKTYEIVKGTYEIPSMDKAMRSEYSQQFFSNTNVIKANDDFETKKNQHVIQCEKPNMKKTLSQDDTNASEMTKKNSQYQG